MFRTYPRKISPAGVDRVLFFFLGVLLPARGEANGPTRGSCVDEQAVDDTPHMLLYDEKVVCLLVDISHGDTLEFLGRECVYLHTSWLIFLKYIWHEYEPFQFAYI